MAAAIYPCKVRGETETTCGTAGTVRRPRMSRDYSAGDARGASPQGDHLNVGARVGGLDDHPRTQIQLDMARIGKDEVAGGQLGGVDGDRPAHGDLAVGISGNGNAGGLIGGLGQPGAVIEGTDATPLVGL